jgi:hypothetical protein
VGLIGVLYLMRTQNVIGGWFLILGMIVILLAMPGVAMLLDRRAAALVAGPAAFSLDGTSQPLEWLGLDEPVSEEDLQVLDRKLDLPEVTGVPA